MKYLVTLKPIGNYFFGGEVTLGDGASQNYFVKSNVLPQASAILGLMRYEILRQHNLLSYNPKEKDVQDRVNEYIGSAGFNLETPASEYGIILNISPVFLTDGSDFYTAMPLDAEHPVSFNSKNRCSYITSDAERSQNSETESQNEITGEPVISGFDPKKYDTYKYWCSPQQKRIEPFLFSQQIGITKNGRKANEKDAFYKQTLVRLIPSLSFVFTVEVSDKHPLELGTRIIPFGGNRSMFVMTIAETKDDIKAKFQPLHRNGRLLALGDTFLSVDEHKKCTFIWGENTLCRYMENSTQKQHSWNRPVKTPVLYHLQSRGSVIYANEETLGKLLNANSALQKLGLNIFI